MKEHYIFDDSEIFFHYSLDLKPNPDKFKMHTHSLNELYYFINGKGIFRIEGNEYPLKSGDVLIMRRAEAHYIDIDPSFPYERASMNFSESIFSDIDPNKVLLKPFYDRDAGKLNRFSDEDFSNRNHNVFINNMLEKTDNQRLQILSGLIPLLNEIYGVFQIRSGEATDAPDTVAYRIIKYINQHLFDDISLDMLCEKFYISKPQICRIIKKHTGSTVWKYITTKRLINAQQLLSMGVPAVKTASECGFNDYSNFYRAYLKQFNTPPGSERKLSE